MPFRRDVAAGGLGRMSGDFVGWPLVGRTTSVAMLVRSTKQGPMFLHTSSSGFFRPAFQWAVRLSRDRLTSEGLEAICGGRVISIRNVPQCKLTPCAPRIETHVDERSVVGWVFRSLPGPFPPALGSFSRPTMGRCCDILQSPS